MQVPVPTSEQLPEKDVRTARDFALWDYKDVDDAQLRIVLEGICEGMSIKEVCDANPAVTAPYREVMRSLHEDTEVTKHFMRARSIQLGRSLDKLIEIAEEDIPEFITEDGKPDKFQMQAWLQNRKIKSDIYNKILRYGSGNKDDSDTSGGGGLVINITNYAQTEKLESATRTIDAQAGTIDE